MAKQRGGEITVKKYSNRRLYDTTDSRYITLEELAQKIRAGNDVRVVDAKSGGDLTQATLAQIILESRRAARLLPVPLLMQLIRMGDDALSEFFSSYMSWALDIYLQARQGAQAMAPFNPFAALPFSGASAFARMLSQSPWAEGMIDPVSFFERMSRARARPRASGAGPESAEPPPNGTPGTSDTSGTSEEAAEGHAEPRVEDVEPTERAGEESAVSSEEIADLRREVEALKRALDAGK